MGISGLLPKLASITRPVHVEEYKGKRVAVDGYCWLHRATYGCSMELCQGTPTNRYITFFMGLVRMLLYHKVEPLIVFDGGRLPAKQLQEEERRRCAPAPFMP